MSTRSQQRTATRERIVEAATEAFAERGFHGASTRDIAQRAGTNQGLITYHFRTKDALWRAVADRIFGRLRATLGERLAALDSGDPRQRAREAIRDYVRFAAAHPELFRLMVEEGKCAEDRMEWLVDTHLKPLYEGLLRIGGPAVGGLADARGPAAGGLADARGSAAGGLADALGPHFYYVLAGAGSLIFAVAPECRRLTGLEPDTSQAVETHADLVARLLVP